MLPATLQPQGATGPAAKMPKHLGHAAKDCDGDIPAPFSAAMSLT